MEKDNRWIAKNFDKLMESHGGRFVAVPEGPGFGRGCGLGGGKRAGQAGQKQAEPHTRILTRFP